MIVQLFFLTLFTASNCRSLGPDDCKDAPGTAWNGTHCVCNDSFLETLVPIEGSGTSESVESSEESSEPELIDLCKPGDDCSDHSIYDPIETLVPIEGSDTSEPVVSSEESSEPELIDIDYPGNDCEPIDPVSRTAKFPPSEEPCKCCCNPCACCRLDVYCSLYNFKRYTDPKFEEFLYKFYKENSHAP